MNADNSSLKTINIIKILAVIVVAAEALFIVGFFFTSSDKQLKQPPAVVMATNATNYKISEPAYDIYLGDKFTLTVSNIPPDTEIFWRVKDSETLASAPYSNTHSRTMSYIANQLGSITVEVLRNDGYNDVLAEIEIEVKVREILANSN
ncbi:MAG: hypothetical protein LBS74_05510 [Oscillospiraceae bacterium]|jgi:flagellar basal body-associated protein FliL|nr:hypothetical protein [Oscillospiraceae bacterium]